MPLNNIPGLFPQSRELLINFDWVDIASATGYVVLEGFNAIDSNGSNYTLMGSTAAKTLIGTWVVGNTGNYTFRSVITANGGTSADLDFDLSQFQLPRTIEGKAYVKIGMGWSAGAGGLNGIVITAKIRKWDGSSETEIASASSATDAIADGKEQTFTIGITVPRTHYKKGETLRLTIQIATTTAAGAYKLGHNPLDTASTDLSATNSSLSFAVPFNMGIL